MEDREIVALYLQRNERAIGETAAKYGSYCFSIAHNILGNREDAEEAVNDAYLGLWSSIPPHRPVVLSTFLGKITRRTAIKRWQRNTTQKRGGGETALALEELSNCVPARDSVEAAMETAELSRLLNRFVRALPQTERNVFVCRYWYLDPISSIAQRYGFSQSKVKSMLSRTRKKLRTYLQKEEIDL
ncbi:MAG: sigma-70 family RNA polymerase sigma factor [Oscillospiraceae bacterium]|nr:sigma-70 family RNA polymerase sigma factor [Oscillospiraceae bacterium]